MVKLFDQLIEFFNRNVQRTSSKRQKTCKNKHSKLWEQLIPTK